MSRSGKRILCVDDDSDTCKLIEAIFGLVGGYDIVTAESAAEALAVAKTCRFDLYLLDSWLPGETGMELCRQLRTLNVTAPVVFLSADARPSFRQTAMQAGAQAYLVKPLDPSTLVKTVEQFLREDTPTGVGAYDVPQA